METEAIRYVILRLLEFQRASGRTPYLKDAVIASATGVDLETIRRELELLQDEELIEVVRQFPTSRVARVRYHKARLRLIDGSLRCCPHDPF